MQITNLVSSTMGLIGGAIGMAVPMAYEMSPLTSLATGTIAAVGVGVTTYGLLNKHGKMYFAEYLAKQIDTTIKAQRDSLQQKVVEAVKYQLPSIISSTSYVDTTIQSCINPYLDNYSTDPQLVFNVLDDIDNNIPHENNPLLKEFVNQVTDSILDVQFSGCYAPLRPLIRKPLDRVIATVAANLLKKTTEIAVEKAKSSSAGNVVNSVELLFGSNLSSLINRGLGLWK